MSNPKLVVNFVDREGNKKAASYETGADCDVEQAQGFVDVLAAQSGARILSFTVVTPATVVNADVYTPGDYDLIGEVARLRFVDNEGSAFAVVVPAPIDTALDANEEVSTVCATAMLGALQDLRGVEGLQYRGGRLIVKDVSNPVLIPVLVAA